MRDDFDQSRRDRGRIEHTAVQQDCIRTSGRNVSLKKRRELPRNCGVARVWKSEFLKRHTCCPARQIGWIATREKTVEDDALDVFTRDLRGLRTADQTAAFGNHRQV